MHKAAQYVRMSTDEQDLSLDVQKAAIAEYGRDNDIEIIATYADEGKSGLYIANRLGMQRLLSDVASPLCAFSRVLVYDISRWGRFQNPDASAYYDYHCRLHGVVVDYVAEAFGSDASPMMTVFKSLKRAMAAEYSRELAIKCRAGQDRVLSLGFEMGTMPCVGYRRQSFGADGTAKRFLARGERKAMQSDRIRWVLGPPAEVELVKRLYWLYVNTDATVNDLVRLLLKEGQTTESGTSISRAMLVTVLRSQAFVGDFVWGAGPNRRNVTAKRHVLVSKDSVPAIVERATWQMAQQKLKLWGGIRRSKSQMLAELAQALALDSHVTSKNLEEHGCGGAQAYANAFGSMNEAYRLVGLDPRHRRIEGLRRALNTRSLRIRLSDDIAALLRDEGIQVKQNRKLGKLIINRQVHIGIHLIWSQTQARCSDPCWYVRRLMASNPFDIVLVVRMNKDDTAKDFFLVPLKEFPVFPRRIRSTLSEEAKAFHLTTGGELVSRVLSSMPLS
jgi:DNA invertase Pin-like site-specific DNA recombinase